MWLRDYHIDGLRLDAVHALEDRRALHVLEELAIRVDALAAAAGRPLVLVAESDLNNPRLITSREDGGYGLTAQWNDDFHHAVHCLVTGERQGYYGDFGAVGAVAKTLTRVYFHDGTWSSFRGRSHGRPVDVLRLPAYRFVCFDQDHDQIGNRATGDRMAATLAGRPAPRGPAPGGGRPRPHCPLHPDAVHGRGVGCRHAVAVLHRPHRPRTGPRCQRGAQGRVRRARLGPGRGSRPAGQGNVPAFQARLGSAWPRAVPVAPRLVPHPALRCAGHGPNSPTPAWTRFASTTTRTPGGSWSPAARSG